jgi:hypothetical protein
MNPTMSLGKHVWIEVSKHKRRYNLLLFVAVVLLIMAFIYGNYQNKAGMEEGWLVLFYNMPIMNSLFLPVVLAAFASRLADIEHKGSMLKCLYTFTSPQKIFAAKVIYGFIAILLLLILQCLALPFMAKILAFPFVVPARYMLFYALSTYLSCCMLFYLQLLFAYFYKNQAVTISIGLVGCFLALFSAYLPTTIFQKLLPWSTFMNSIFIGMDWNRTTRATKWFLLEIPGDALLYSIGWLLLFIGISLWLLGKSSVEETEGKKVLKHSAAKVSIRSYPIEFMKLKGSPSWIAFFVIPLLSAVIGTANYVGNIAILTDGWYSLWTQHTLFLCYFFMPVIIAIFAGCIWRIEHTGTNMNILMTHASPVKIVLSKYGATVFITTISLVWVVALYLIAGVICHIEGSVPRNLGLWLLFGLMGAYTICAVQLFLSLVIRNFILPVVLAFMGGIIGLVAIARNMPYAVPYALLSLSMTEKNQNMNIGLFLMSAGMFIFVFLFLSILYLKRADVKSHE